MGHSRPQKGPLSLLGGIAEDQRMDVLPPRPRLPWQSSWLAWINWGHGMIGKATVAVVALIVLLSVVASRVPSENAMLALAGIGFVIVVSYLCFLVYIARHHPNLAATEGPTYVHARQLDLAAKNLPKPLNPEIVADPQNPTLLNVQADKGAS
jgi:hypothetical protein